MNLPNKLTLARILLAPAFIVFMTVEFGEGLKINFLIALILFALASVTDFADGHIARKYNLITNFGKFLDPLADKFLVVGALVCLCLLEDNTLYGKMLLAATTTVILREFAVSGMRLVVAGGGVVVAANIYGKIKTVSQMVFVLFAITIWMLSGYNLGIFLTVLHIIRNVALLIMTVMTVLSGIVYFKSYWKYINPAQ